MRVAHIAADDTETPKPLRAVTTYYSLVGVSFSLFPASGSRALAYIELSFEHTLRLQNIKYPTSEHTGSPQGWKQILEWINQCTDRHSTCLPSNTSTPHIEWPQRVVAVGNIGNPQIRICETSKLECSELIYLTLSHCWGDIVPIRLLHENYSIFLEGIKLDTLPKTFREAIEVTRKLKVGYLWIDSLCIIQDSVKDWANESSRMYDIYKNSHLNLMAAASSDSTGGLFYPRPPLAAFPRPLKIGQGADTKDVAQRYKFEADRLSSLVLLTRAWVHQEWLLAPRILIFGAEELHWECNEFRGSEMVPNEDPENEPYSAMRKDWLEMHDKSHHERWMLWWKMVSAYSEKKLTRPSDKLVAMAGLASDLGGNWDGITYHAGLWSYRLRRNLLWSRRGVSENDSAPQPFSYTAPSWSWASGNGSVEPPRFDAHSDGLVELLETSIQLSTVSNPYGTVLSGWLRLKGPMIRAKITKKSTSSWEIDLVAWLTTDFKDKWGLQKVITAGFMWDDKAIHEMAEALNVFLVPCEVLLPDNFKLLLQGLVLLPTYLHKGQFRRIGRFSVVDLWYDPPKDWNAVYKESLLDSDTNNSVSDDDTSKSDQSEQVLSDRKKAAGVIDPNLHGITDLQLHNLLEAMSRVENKEKGLDEENKQSQNMKRKMQCSGEISIRNDKGSSEVPLNQDDPYHHGDIDIKLGNRYVDELDEDDYPQINSLLTFIEIIAGCQEDDGYLSDGKWGTYHGDGYFTLEIV
ncbi:hypothetical protein GJ744_010346 [Endocarpon pusillum]|uniref:Heterokaryon incompatibility domain-containing protein n=1 Tax=Endocarpon pusillum TaxID=364733 RepID=A0A8H7AEC5_9EURO|nr:hypothetical protein GJ744_010346 [Endocarpon pusillum]